MYEIIKERCRKNGKWRGFRLGEGDQLLVRIRRKNRKNFFLRVDDVVDADKVVVSDKLGAESGVAQRYNEQCFFVRVEQFSCLRRCSGYKPRTPFRFWFGIELKSTYKNDRFYKG